MVQKLPLQYYAPIPKTMLASTGRIFGKIIIQAETFIHGYLLLWKLRGFIIIKYIAYNLDKKLASIFFCF